jgi:Rieske 2Fe-2S family protein
MSRAHLQIQERPKGFTLDREFYVSPEIFELDIQKVFFTQWLYVGHESQIPQPGDFLTYQIAGESIVVARTAAGSLSAFFNVCRHRGARVVQQTCGNVPAFRCLYHNWTYSLDGALMGAPGMISQLRREDYGLHPVWVESWQGFIHINLSPSKPQKSMAEMLEAAASAMERFQLDKIKIAKTIVYNVPANWKLFEENYRECYHCLANHPEFCATVPVDKIHVNRRQTSTRLIQAPNVTFSKYALRPGAKTQSISGEMVSIPMGDLAESEEVPMHALNFYPAHAFAFGLDHGMAYSLHPLSPTESLLTVHWYVSSKAEAGRDYEVDNVIAFWDATHRQDIGLCAINQEGVNSRRYRPGPYSPTEEDEIEHFLNFYSSVLSAS